VPSKNGSECVLAGRIDVAKHYITTGAGPRTPGPAVYHCHALAVESSVGVPRHKTAAG
jgi:hypothetical protein